MRSSATSSDLRLGLSGDLVDADAYEHAVARFRAQRIVLPTFAELADPSTQPPAAIESLAAVDPDAPDARNLWRVHWYNAADRRSRVPVPVHMVLPPELTGIEAT